MELSLGVDLTGGEDWQAAIGDLASLGRDGRGVSGCTPRSPSGPAVQALTVFLKGYHPFAAQGGATLFDNVRVVDLGP